MATYQQWSQSYFTNLTPEQHDVVRMIHVNRTRSNSTGYTPFRATGPGTSSLVDQDWIVSSKYSQDHRLSYIYGHVVPPVDVEWFTGRLDGPVKTAAYVKYNGDPQNILPGNNGDYTPDGRRKGVTNYTHNMGMDIKNNYNNTHYLFDLYVNFEFIIPASVCDKISGFRVVRAERGENDRRVIQQGLLNQTAQYGDANLGLEAGYGNSNFSSVDNNGFDNDPVFVNELNETTASPVEQPEYNTYLNGYLGLAENSHLAFYKDDLTTGIVTQGGNTSKRVFSWTERGNIKRFGGGPTGTAGKAIPHCREGSDKYYGPGSISMLKKTFFLFWFI